MPPFVIAAVLACLSGWLYAHLQRFVNPTPFGINQGIEKRPGTGGEECVDKWQKHKQQEQPTRRGKDRRQAVRLAESSRTRQRPAGSAHRFT